MAKLAGAVPAHELVGPPRPWQTRRMIPRRHFITGAAALALVPRGARAAPVVERGVDPIMEWLAALARAAGFREYEGGLDAWTTVLAPALGKIAGHPAVRMLRRARVTHGLAFNAMASMAAHLEGDPQALSARVPFDPLPARLDERWQGVAGDAFMDSVSDAARIARFDEIWREHASLVRAVEVALARATNAFDIDWFAAFFGVPLPARLRILASMGTSGNNYGARITLGDTRETLAVLGAYTGYRGAPEVSDISILVHEVGHDFVNPLVEAQAEAFEAVGRRLYATDARGMRRRSFGDWIITLCESVLRACVVRYLAAHGGDVAAELDYQRRAGFPWTGQLADALAGYEADRARWPALADYVPELVRAVGTAADNATLGRPHSRG